MKYKSYGIFKRCISFLLTVVMVLSMLVTNGFGFFGDTAVVHAGGPKKSASFTTDDSGGWEWGTATITADSGTGTFYVNDATRSSGSSGLTMKDIFADENGTISCLGKLNLNDDDSGAHSLGKNVSYLAHWTITMGKRDGKATYEASCDLYVGNPSYETNSWGTSSPNFSGGAVSICNRYWGEPQWDTKTLFDDEISWGDKAGSGSMTVKYNGKNYTCFSSDTSADLAKRMGIKADNYNGAKGVSVSKTTTYSQNSNGSNRQKSSLGLTSPYYVFMKVHITHKYTVYPQRYYGGGVSAWRYAEVEITGKKTTSGDFADSYTTDPKNNKGTATFKTYTKSGSTYSEFNGSSSGTFSFDKDGNCTNTLSLGTDDIPNGGIVLYMKETDAPGNVRDANNNINCTSFKFNGTAITANSDGYYQLPKITEDDLGKSFEFTANNKNNYGDPRVRILKTMDSDGNPRTDTPTGTSGDGAEFRVQYYDITPGKEYIDNNYMKFVYLSALTGGSAKNAADGAYSSAAVTGYYDSKYVNDTNLYPGNFSGIQGILTTRGNDAVTKAKAGDLKFSSDYNYNPANYRQWEAVTHNGGLIQFTKNTLSTYFKTDSDYPFFKDPNDNKDFMPYGTYVITEYKGTNAYYSNPLTVTIITFENNDTSNGNKSAVWSQYRYPASGIGNPSYTSGQTRSISMNDQATPETSLNQNEFPKAGSLTVEKSLEDQFPNYNSTTSDDTGHGKDANHDGDSDGDITSLETTMALYYRGDNTNKLCLYWPNGAHNGGDPTKIDVSDGTDKLVCTFKTTKKTTRATGDKYKLHYNVSGDPEYAYNTDTVGNYVYDFADLSLSMGNYYIIETAVPTGTVNQHPDKAHLIPVTVKPDKRTMKTTTVKWTEGNADRSVDNTPIKGTVAIRKTISEVDTHAGANAKRIGEGDIHLAGAVFEITNQSTHPVWLVDKKTWYAVGEVVGYMVTDNNGETSTIYEKSSYSNGTMTTSGKTVISKLPYGTYKIQEVKAPTGLMIKQGTGSWNAYYAQASHYLKVRTNNTQYNLTYSVDTYMLQQGDERVGDGWRDNTPMRGGFSIEKVDAETGERVPQGNASFENARFVLYNMSEYPVWVDLNGNGVDDGDTEWFAGTKYPGVTSNGTSLAPVAGGTPIVAKDTIYAFDKDGNKTDAYTFRLDQTSYDGLPGYWAPKASKNYAANQFLPYGTYRIEEVSADETSTHDPEGYHVNEPWTCTFQIREDREWISLTDDTDTTHKSGTAYRQGKALDEVPERAGIQIQKYDKEDHALKTHGDANLSGGVFAIYNTSSYKDDTVYAHVYTDKNMNGYVVTDQNGDGVLSDDEKKDYIYSVTDAQIDAAFAKGLDADTWSCTLDDGTLVRPAVVITTDANGIAKTSNIALPYGDYVIREVKAPTGYHIDRNYNVHFTITYDESVSETSSSTDKRSDYRITSDWKSAPNASGSTGKASATVTHITEVDKTYTSVGKANTITGIGADYTATPIEYNDDRFNALGSQKMFSEKRSSAYDAIVRGTFVLQKVDKDDYEAYDADDYAASQNGALKYSELYLDSKGRYVVEPQGDARFDKTAFRVYNRSEAGVYVLTYDASGNSVYTYVPENGIVWEFVTDENGYYEAPDDLLPFGTYEIEETNPPTGYLNSKDEQSEGFVFHVGYEKDGSTKAIDYNHERDEDTAENDLVLDLPGYTIDKISAGRYTITNNQTGNLVTDSKFTIINKDIIDSYTDDTDVFKDDMYIFTNTTKKCDGYKKVATDKTVYEVNIGRDGVFVLPQLVSTQYGSHYTVDGQKVKGTLTVKLDEFTSKFEPNLVSTDSYSFGPYKDKIIRGGVQIRKVDEDDFENSGLYDGPQGDARFENAEFSIYNISDHYVWVMDEKGNWRRTSPATDDGKWISQDDVRADTVYDPEEALTRLAFNRLSAIEHTGMTNDAKSTKSDNQAYTDEIAEFCGATTVEGLIDKYHDNHENNEALDKARLGNNDLQDILQNTVPVKKIYTDANGFASTGDHDLPYGTYIIYESKAPTGYMLPRCWYRIFQVREDGHITAWDEEDFKELPNVKTDVAEDTVIRGDVQITKFDAETEVSNALNPDALSGIQFRIYNVSDAYTYLWELTGNERNPLVDTKDTKYNHPLKIVNDDYFNPETSDFWTKLDADPKNYVATIETHWNPETQTYTAETFVHDEETGEKVQGDNLENCIRGALPYGTYLIRECKTNTKYEFTDGYPWVFSIREEGEVVTVGWTAGDTSGANEKHPIEFYDNIERNDVWFNKIEDANSRRIDSMWVITNEDTLERHVIVTNGGSDDDNNGNGTYESGADVNLHTYHTNANDKFLKYIDENHLLDTDTETITEKDSKDEAYTGDKNLPVAITMGSEGKHVVTKTQTTPGSVDGETVVVSDDGLNNNGMGYAEYDAGTWFGVGEFTVWTPGTSVNPHIKKGQATEQIVTYDENTGEEIILVGAPADDSLKAFPYGHYTIKEVRTDSNQGLILQNYSFTINNANRDLKLWSKELDARDREVDLGTITDDKMPKIEINTILTDVKTESHVANASSDEVILNEDFEYSIVEGEVSYFANDNYELRGELWAINMKEDGTYETIGDAPIATSKVEDFKIRSMYGKGSMKYTFNGNESDLTGKKVVSYVYLYRTVDDGQTLDEPKLIQKAEKIDDVNEQVTFPEITSNFIVPATKNKTVPVATNVTITDKITATNLYPDTKYAVKAKLMAVDAEGNAEELKDADGEPIWTALCDSKFVSGVTEAEFTATFKNVDTTKLEGRTLVAYAYLYANKDTDEPVATHEDIKDKDETIYVPVIHTDAIDGVSGDQQGVCIETDKIIDTVTYENLAPGKYTMKATIFAVDAEGNATALLTGEGEEATQITGTQDFEVADETAMNGTVDVEISVDSKDYAGKTVVVYEELNEIVPADEEDGEPTLVKITTHSEATDTRQQIHYPEIHTTANDKNTETKSALAIKDTELIDTIEYHNLIVGNEYVFRGTLMTLDEEGNAVAVMNGNEPVTAEATMTAETTDGTKDVIFKFDATEYKGKDIVVYEKLLSGKNTDIEYTQHEDINDEGQTVHFPEIGTTAKDAQTGQNFGYATENTVIVDTVHYKNLVSGVTYEVVGTLYDKESGKPVGVVPTEDTDTTTEETATTTDDDKETSSTVYADDQMKAAQAIVDKPWSEEDKAEIIEMLKEYVKAYNKDINPDDYDNLTKEVYESLQQMLAEDIAKAMADAEAATGTDATDDHTSTDATTTDADADGKEYVTNSTKFEATGKDGDVDVTLTFNAVPFRGRDVVVFEKLYVYKPDGTRVEVPLAEHEDINDEGQTIHYPEIGTEAFEKNTGLHETKAETKLVLVDRVRYTNVVPGIEYTVTGTLMDKETNQAVTDAQGNVVTSTAKVTPTEKDGYAEVEFEFDASYMRGKTTVAFETWSWENIELAVHADINDAPQTVYFPDIHTTATSGTSGAKLLDPIDVEVISDEIAYKNVIVGHKYRIEGYLVDVETGEVLKDKDGKEFRNSVEFTAETTEGKISMDFGKMNASEFIGKSIVVYESIYNIDGENPVDLVDEHVTENTEQTVTVTKPTVSTLLGEAETGNKALAANENVKLVDTITYSGLIPGNTYKTVSTLVFADTGETVKDAKGKDIVVEATVVPEKDALIGTAEFNFDGSNLKGKVVVAYEDVYRVIDGKEYLIAQERDLKNEDQTVTFPDLHTTATSSLTKNHTLEKDTKAIIVDKVEYSGLQVGHTYKLEGTLMDKETGKAVEGVEKVTQEFTPTESSGFVEMQVTVDTTKLEGHKLVMFETCYENDKELVIHADIEDEEQTVTVCELHTKATGADGKSKTVDMAKDTVIKDTVEFKGLTPGKTYVLYGEVYSKEQYTGTEVKGKEKTNTTTESTTTSTESTTEAPAADATNFTENGDVKTATVDGLMIEMPKDTVGAIGMPENRMRFDKVGYMVNGSDGQASFTLRGKLVYRAKGSIVDDWRVSAKCIDGKNNVIETVTIVIQSGIKDATKSTVFNVTTDIPMNTKKVIIVDNAVADGTTLNPVPAGKTETTTQQTTTEATTQQTTTEAPKLTDTKTTVTENKGNAKPLATNTIEFTPKEADGEVEIEFTVDTTNLDGHHLVCFETVTEKDSKALIGEHKDINDEDQTVTVKTSTTVQTGVDRFAVIFAILSIILMLITVGGYAYLRKNRKALVITKGAEIIDLNDTDE